MSKNNEIPVKMAFDNIWVEILGTQKTKEGIILPKQASERLNDYYVEVKILKIGSTIPKQELGNDEDGYLQVGDIAIVDRYLPGLRDQKVTLDGKEYGLIRTFDIVGLI